MGTNSNTGRALVITVAAAAIVYALTFSRSTSYDSLAYFRGVEMGSRGDLIQPHHLIYLPLQKAWFSLWRFLGYDGRVVLPMKVLNLVGTCLAVLAFGMTLRFFVKGLLLFSTLVSGFAFAYVTWHFASQGEPVPFFLLFSALNLYLMVRLLAGGETGWGTAIVFGLATAVGVLFHQELVLMLPFSASVLWLSSGRDTRGRVLGLYLAVAVIAVGVPYLVVGKLLVGAASAGEIVKWASGYLGFFEGAEFARWGNLGITAIVNGITRAFLGGDALKAYVFCGAARDHLFYIAIIPSIGAMLFIGAGLAALLARLRFLLGRIKSHIVLIVTMTVVFGGVAAWWRPHNRIFWSPVVPCILLLAGMGYASLPRLRGAAAAKNTMCMAFIILIIWGNLIGGIVAKHAHNDEKEKILLELVERVGPSDVVVLAAGRHNRLLDYYAPEIHSLVVVTGRRGKNPLFEDLRRETVLGAKATLARGHAVFMSSEVLASGQGPEEFLGLPAGMEIDARPAFNCIDTFSGVAPYQMLKLTLRSPSAAF